MPIVQNNVERCLILGNRDTCPIHGPRKSTEVVPQQLSIHIHSICMLQEGRAGILLQISHRVTAFFPSSKSKLLSTLLRRCVPYLIGFCASGSL